MSTDLLKMIKIKNKLFFRKKRQPNNENIRILYNIFRNRVNRELKNQKKNIILSISKITIITVRKYGRVLDQL